tara:strand:+ start:473 stop:742 length:270 start_codon:yes stop_codon:yes gene_type:complete
MEIKSLDKVQLKIVLDDREYVLFLPIGAPFEDVVKVCSHYTAAMSSAHQQYLAKQKEEAEKELPPSEEKESDDVVIETDQSSSGDSEEL